MRSFRGPPLAVGLAIALAVALVPLLAACGDDGGDASGDASPDGALLPGDGAAPDGAVTDGGPGDAGTPDGGAGDVTVHPDRIGDVLTNPGMGFADFHFGWWCNLPPVTYTPQECATRVRSNWPANYPVAGTAYFRWHWRDLEPVRGQIDFDMMDTALQSANALGETLGFRVMVIDEGGTGLPQWLMEAPYGVAGEWLSSGGGGTTTFWPDVRDTTFLTEHARFIAALGQRYDDHPALDHVDIGTVGCWGEWNTACLDSGGGLFDVYSPQSPAEVQAIRDAYQTLIDDHLTAFAHTPVVMLGIGSGGGDALDVFVHAIRGGAGWRVDCWGDWGIWGPSWSHHEDLYPALIANATAAEPAFSTVWQRAPVQLEVCGVMQDWHDLGWTTTPPDGEVYKTFQWALDQHASVLNAKSSPVPADYVSAVDDLLLGNGYRLVVDAFNHHSRVTAGETTLFTSRWSNLGVAPHYRPRTLTYRLRGSSRTETFESPADTTTWLPGSWDVRDTIPVPADMPPGLYQVDIALVDRPGTAPDTPPLPPLGLAIAGRRADGWYPLSELTVE